MSNNDESKAENTETEKRKLIIQDSDFISAFIWAGRTDLLFKMDVEYYIPDEVIAEIENTNNILFKGNLTPLVKLENKQWKRYTMLVGSNEYASYISLKSNLTKEKQVTIYNKTGIKPPIKIDPGEAACIAIAKELENSIVASNNLKDVSSYLKLYGIKGLTTAEYMGWLYDHNYISKDEADTIWNEMVTWKRKIGYNTFDDFLSSR